MREGAGTAQCAPPPVFSLCACQPLSIALFSSFHGARSFACGLGGARLARLGTASRLAVAVETSVQNKLIAIAVCTAVFGDAAERDRSFVVPLVYALFSSTWNTCALALAWKAGHTHADPGAGFDALCRQYVYAGFRVAPPEPALCDEDARSDTAQGGAASSPDVAVASLELELASTRSPARDGELGC